MRTTAIKLCLAVLLLGLLSACGTYTFHGTVLDPPSTAPDFMLTDHNGQPWSLSQQRGKVVLLFFGFTSCPDICPTAMSTMSGVHRKLGKDAEHIQVVFVTLDPERDTQERLAGYTTGFNPTFMGLYGTQAELDTVIKAYGVTAIRRELPNSGLQYTIDHSPFIYVIDQQGIMRELLQDGIPIDDMVSDIRYLVRNGGA